jgi:uncharacterized RDD family membrane protein YckC
VSVYGLELEQALASADAQLDDVLDLVDATVEHAAAEGDDAILAGLAARLEDVASQRGGEWSALAIAAARARALAAPPVASAVPKVEVPHGPPSAPPVIPVAESISAVGAKAQPMYAGWWQRVFAFLLDWVVVGFSSVWLDLSGRFGFVAFVLIPAYFAVFPAVASGVTPGKAALGIAIRVADGTQIGFAVSLWRVVAMSLLWVTGVGAIVDAILAGTDAKRQSAHDKMAGTIVVRTRA